MIEALMEKQLERLQKLLRMAGSTANANESALAATRAVDYLQTHPLPVRWLVPKGTTLRIVPTSALASQSESKAKLRVVTAHGDNWFFEAHRVKNEQAANALRAGHLYFEKNGYSVLVPAGRVDVYL